MNETQFPNVICNINQDNPQPNPHATWHHVGFKNSAVQTKDKTAFKRFYSINEKCDKTVTFIAIS